MVLDYRHTDPASQFQRQLLRPSLCRHQGLGGLIHMNCEEIERTEKSEYGEQQRWPYRLRAI